MARRVASQTHRGFNTGAVASAATPTACPICGETPAVARGEKRHQVLEAHIIAQHRPDVACPREHRTDITIDWKLDWDAVVHQQPKIWYCSECGYYRQAE
jgi:ribosomal protein L37AE/L43A